MATIRHQIWNIPATHPDVLALIPDGINGIQGDDESPDSIPRNSPWLYLSMQNEVQVFDSPNCVEGWIQWQSYDFPHAGYTRLRRLINVLNRVMTEAMPENMEPIVDADTEECVYEVKTPFIGTETAAPDMGLLRLDLIIPYRKTIMGEWP